GLHPDPAHHAGSGAACARPSGHGRDGLAAGARRHWIADLLSSDRRAAGFRQAMVDRQGEAKALALSVLSLTWMRCAVWSGASSSTNKNNRLAVNVSGGSPEQTGGMQ